jgi:hypothetical protein
MFYVTVSGVFIKQVADKINFSAILLGGGEDYSQVFRKRRQNVFILTVLPMQN